MKSVIISVIILALTVGFVTVNSVCSLKKLNEILELLDGIESGEDIERLTKKWEDTERLLSLTTHRRELDEITHTINDIGIALNNNDRFAYEDAKSHAKELINEIVSSQHLDFRSVI